MQTGLAEARGLILRLAREAAWAPIAVFLCHAILGELVGHEPYVDPVMHFCGGAAITLFLRRAAELGVRWIGEPSRLGLDLLAFGLGCFVALLWELVELSSDIFFGTHIQISAANALRDLALGAAGAGVYLVARRYLRRRSSDRPR